MTTVRLEWRERTAVITLDRPERRNALDLDALKEMGEALGEVAEDAQVGSPFAKLGGLPDCGFHFLAASRIGMRRTLELIYTGRLLNGREAEEIGLVNRCVPASELLAVTMEMAESAAQGPTAAFALSKSLLRAAEDGAMSLAEVLAAEAKGQAAALRTADAQEGLTAFLERRAPVFRGS